MNKKQAKKEYDKIMADVTIKHKEIEEEAKKMVLGQSGGLILIIIYLNKLTMKQRKKLDY